MPHAMMRASFVSLAIAVALPQPTPAQTPAGCKPVTGDRPWMDTTQTPECRAALALAAMTPEQKLAFRGTNERLGLGSPGGSDGQNGVIGGGFAVDQTPVTQGRRLQPR